MNPAVLTPDCLFPFKGSSSTETPEDSLTPYKLSLLILVAEYFEYREKAAANQNGYRTLLKGLKLLSTNAAGAGGIATGVDRDDSYVPPKAKDASMSIAADDSMDVAVDQEDDDAEGPKDSKPAKRKLEDPEAAVDATAAAAAAAWKQNDASAAFLSEKNKCDFALLLLGLLQSGEMDFAMLLARVKKSANPHFCHLYKRKIQELLHGGVHALFDFRETGVDVLLQESSSADTYSIHKSSFLGLFLRRLNLAFKSAQFPQVVSLFESLLAYVQPTLKLDPELKAMKPYGLWTSRKNRFKEQIFEDIDGDSTYAAKSNAGLGEGMELEDSLLDEKLKPKHVSTPFVAPTVRKVFFFDDDEESVESAPPRMGVDSSSFPIALGDLTNFDGEILDISVAAKSGNQTGSLSQKQVEYFIATQVNLLVHNETKALPPKQLQACINNLVSWNPDTAALHYLSFLNAVRCNEYNAAIHSLHHYFDRQHPKGFQSTNPRNAANDGTARGPDSHLINPKNYRYGALNLAALHHRFSQNGEALSALHEAIQMAQEAGDAICLQYALGWLHLINEQGEGNVSSGPSSLAEIITRGIKKSNELLLPFLSSLGIQSLARQLALSSDSTKPHHIFEGISRSDVINCQHSMLGLMATSFAQKAALWRMYGKTQMASLSTQALLQLNSVKYGVPQFGSPEVLALVYLAETHASHGLYEAADSFFSFLSSVFPVGTPNSSEWLRAKHRVDFARSVGEADLEEAAKAQSSLAALDETEGALLDGLLLFERSLYSSALDRLHALLSTLDGPSEYRGSSSSESPASPASPASSTKHLREKRHLLRAVVLQAIGETLCQMGSAPQAIQYFLKALTFSEARHHDYRATEGRILLALTQYQLKMPNQALAVIEENLASVLTHGPPSLQAKALFLRSRCRVAATSKYGDDVAKRETSFREALVDADRARNLFHSARDIVRLRQCLTFMARLHHHLDNREERNRCAKQFRNLETEYPKVSSASSNGYRAF